MSRDGKRFAVRVKEPGMKIGVLLSADGTLVNRWLYAASMTRDQADRIAAQIVRGGDEAKVVPFGQGIRRRGRS